MKISVRKGMQNYKNEQQIANSQPLNLCGSNFITCNSNLNEGYIGMMCRKTFCRGLCLNIFTLFCLLISQ